MPKCSILYLVTRQEWKASNSQCYRCWRSLDRAQTMGSSYGRRRKCLRSYIPNKKWPTWGWYTPGIEISRHTRKNQRNTVFKKLETTMVFDIISLSKPLFCTAISNSVCLWNAVSGYCFSKFININLNYIPIPPSVFLIMHKMNIILYCVFLSFSKING